jgi:DMSO/TMAO reductase YedYZ molybdopterin-dependent catalytic subunit
VFSRGFTFTFEERKYGIKIYMYDICHIIIGGRYSTMQPKSSILVVASLMCIVLIAVSIGNVFWRMNAMNGTSTLSSVEVKEYKGQRLSSIDDFRENSIRGPQFVDNESYRLVVTGLVNNEIEYSYDEVISNFQLFEKVVTLYCVEGWDVTILWEGVLVKDLLEEAGINPRAKIVIFYAYDGYSTSLPLDYIFNKDILIAHKMNGVVLPPERGFPFQLVAESKYGYKWIKWITQIELSDDVDYRGYWESRGFSNNADLP